MSLAPSSLPRVSIVIVSWNTRTLLLEALASFLPLRGAEGEVIVVDNASADGSAEAVEAAYPEVRVLRNARNLGFAGGVNTGLRAAREPLVLLLNTDTLVLGDAIPKLLAYAQGHPEAGIIGPRVLNADRTLQRSYFRFPSLLNLALSSTYLYKLFPRSRFFNREYYAGLPTDRASAVDAVSGCAFLVRREVIEQVGVLDEGFFMYAEETDFCFRARAAGWSVHYAPVGEIVHLGGGSSRLQSRRMFLEFRRSLLRFHRKHGGPLAALAARGLLALTLLLRIPYWALRACLPGAARERARARLGNYVAGVRLLLGDDAAGDAPPQR